MESTKIDFVLESEPQAADVGAWGQAAPKKVKAAGKSGKTGKRHG